MPPADIQADIDAIKAFAKNLTGQSTPLGLQPSISADSTMKSWATQVAAVDFKPGSGLVQLPAGKLDFGQTDPVIDSLMAGAASQLGSRYNTGFEGFAASLNDFLAALVVLSEAASTIATNYQGATDAALSDIGLVKQALDNAPAPPTVPGA